MTFRSFVRPLLGALSLALVATAAAPAFAEGAKDAHAAEARGKGKDRKHGKTKLQFPMTAENFSKVVEKRLSKAREKLGDALSKNGVADDKKSQILKEFDTGAAKVREAAKTAGKDGTVTKEEAKTVRETTKTLRKELRDKYLPKKARKETPKDV